MASKEGNINSLYAELSRLGQNGEYERAIKTANKILQIAPEEEEAFHCKIVSLIQLTKFQDALRFINKQPKLSKNLVFEKAYCQYRLNQPRDAFQTVNAVTNLDQKLRELKAQILYRLEEYDECFELYKTIIKNSNDDYEEEREANLSAVVANLCVENSGKDLPKLKEHTFELTYNAACQLVGKGLYAEAEKKLKAAEKLCRETLEEDGATEEDIEAEMGIIKGQLAYCLQMQGQEKDAQAIYNALLKSKPSDIGLVAVASNNSVTINRDENIFDSKKKMKSATAEGVEHKLTKAQRKIIALNQCLLTIYTNQIEQGKQLCARLTESYPDCSADSALIQAAQMMRDNRTKEAVGFLKKFSENHKDRELELKLACVQLLLSSGEKRDACRLLESLGDNVNRAGVISALVALYLSDCNLDKASAVFKNAVEWYKNRVSNQGDLSALWRQAADFHLRNGDPQVAANSLEELLRLNPNDNKTLAQLVTAYAMFDPIKAQAISKKLPAFNVTNTADIEMLESSNWLMSTKIIKKVTKVEPSPKPGALSDDELMQKKKKKKSKKRKGKLPKNFDPAVPPDPERWLPKYQRTGYKKKKDRRNKDVGKGTQGATAGASDMYDITKMPSHTSKNSPNPSSPSSDSQGPRQQQRRFQQKKKKKGATDFRITVEEDSDLLDDVQSDVKNFSDGGKEKRVLVFPPVNNYRRFLIHKLVEEEFPSLTTFSIGAGDGRRTVVCYKSDYLEHSVVAENKKVEEPPPAPPQQQQSSKSVESSCPVQPKRERRSNAMPSIGIYRPPAARRNEQAVTCDHAAEKEVIGDALAWKAEAADTAKKKDACGVSMFRNAISSIRTQNRSPAKREPRVMTPSKAVEDATATPASRPRQRRPDMKVYVPKARREQEAKAAAATSVEVEQAANVENGGGVLQKDVEEAKNRKRESVECSAVVSDVECAKEVSKMGDATKRTRSEASHKSNGAATGKSEVKLNTTPTPAVAHQVSPTSLWIEAQNEVGGDREEGTPLVERSPKPGSGGSSGDEGSVVSLKPSEKAACDLDPDDCDWESMFDDSGECLCPSLLEQLSSAVGAVTIEKPKSNYDSVRTKTLDMVGNDFPHVIEIYNFPPEFQLQDLMAVFSQFKNSGFEIKWVDDTHALGIFSNSQIVTEVLALRHPFVKTRSLKEGTMLSKAKARRSADKLLPYKARPDTCPALARRLVTGALGVRLPTSREEREAERKILTQAREKKRLEARQREEAWEGTFTQRS